MWACRFTPLGLSFPVCRTGVRISTRGVLAGMELEATRSPECGELVVGAGASSLGRWARIPGTWHPGPVGLPQSPRLTRHIPWPWTWPRKSSAHSPSVGTRRNKQTARSPGGAGACACRRGRGRRPIKGAGGRFAAPRLGAPPPWEKYRSFMCMSAGYETRTFSRLKETHPDLWKALPHSSLDSVSRPTARESQRLNLGRSYPRNCI